MTPAPVDVLFTNGHVFAGRTSREASVAVSGGRIVAVDTDRAAGMAGPQTEVVDLGGGLLVPGFQDAHVHPVQGGMDRLACDLNSASTEPGYLDLIRDYADSHREQDWVSGAGWAMSAFAAGLPRRESLDVALPDRPGFFSNRDGHGGWANSRALELAGITAATPDPSDGRIERDTDGSPTGCLHEGAMDLVTDLMPVATFDEQVAGLLEAQRYLHSMGITAWQDAILGNYSHIHDASAAYQHCARQGVLTAKVVGALWWDRSRGVEQIPELVERRQAFAAPGFSLSAVKIMQDGIVENFTAGMTSPYLDVAGVPTENRGLSMVDPAALPEIVTELDRNGFQVHVHAIGDRAVREALDAFEAARAVHGSNDRRHHIAHIQVINPDDIARFAELEVTANMQPLWATHEEQMDELTIPFLGPERSTWQYPFGSLQASGAELAAGSDWPVSSPNPLWGIHVAVNRSVPPEAGDVLDPFLPEQSLDVVTALSAYTAGSARLNHLDDTGTISVGAAADLAVLDRDISTCPAEEIGTTRVLATYVDGRAVFQA